MLSCSTSPLMGELTTPLNEDKLHHLTVIAVTGGKGNGRLASTLTSLSWCRIDEHEEKAVSLVYLSHWRQRSKLAKK